MAAAVKVPTDYSASDLRRLGAASKHANQSRRLLSLAAVLDGTLLVRSQKWSSLRAWGMKIARQRGMARARVAVACKLAVILPRMWSDGSKFRWGKDPTNGATAAA